MCEFLARVVWAASYHQNPDFPHLQSFIDTAAITYRYIGCNFKYPISPPSTEGTHIFHNVDFQAVAESAESWHFWNLRRLSAKLAWVNTARVFLSECRDSLSQLGCSKPTPSDYRWAWAEAIVMSFDDETKDIISKVTKPSFCWLNSTTEAQDWTLDFDKVYDLSTNEIVAECEPISLDKLVNSKHNYLDPKDKPHRDSIINSIREFIASDALDEDDDDKWEVTSS